MTCRTNFMVSVQGRFWLYLVWSLSRRELILFSFSASVTQEQSAKRSFTNQFRDTTLSTLKMTSENLLSAGLTTDLEVMEYPRLVKLKYHENPMECLSGKCPAPVLHNPQQERSPRV